MNLVWDKSDKYKVFQDFKQDEKFEEEAKVRLPIKDQENLMTLLGEILLEKEIKKLKKTENSLSLESWREKGQKFALLQKQR